MFQNWLQFLRYCVCMVSDSGIRRFKLGFSVSYGNALISRCSALVSRCWLSLSACLALFFPSLSFPPSPKQISKGLGVSDRKGNGYQTRRSSFGQVLAPTRQPRGRAGDAVGAAAQPKINPRPARVGWGWTGPSGSFSRPSCPISDLPTEPPRLDSYCTESFLAWVSPTSTLQ